MSPSHSQDELASADNGPNHHLYSLGQFVATDPFKHQLLSVSDMPSNHSFTVPARRPIPSRSSTAIHKLQARPPAEKKKVSLSADELGSGSGSDNTSPVLESSAEVPKMAHHTVHSHAIGLPFSKGSQVCMQKNKFNLKSYIHFNRTWRSPATSERWTSD